MPYYNRNRKFSTKRFRSSTINRNRIQEHSEGEQLTRNRKKFRSRKKRRIDTTGRIVKSAENRLRNFKQASILAVAITGFIMLVLAPSEAGLSMQASVLSQTQTTDSSATADRSEPDTSEVDSTSTFSSQESAKEAISALQNLWNGFYYNLPKFLIAITTLVLAWLLVRLLTFVLGKIIGNWHSAKAIISIVSISVWLLAIGVAISIVAGDIRALVGSLGLIGLAFSSSLQTPIESFN
jgi:hypothetical protein